MSFDKWMKLVREDLYRAGLADMAFGIFGSTLISETEIAYYAVCKHMRVGRLMPGMGNSVEKITFDGWYGDLPVEICFQGNKSRWPTVTVTTAGFKNKTYLLRINSNPWECSVNLCFYNLVR